MLTATRARARVAPRDADDLPALLRAGYRAVDFFLAADRSRGQYLLALRDPA
jgi:hypothetical protein